VTTEAEQSACVGKHPFPTKLAALKVAKRMAGAGRGGIGAFRCPHCGFFHIGHTEKNVSKADRRRYYREMIAR
jgi:hypothetical protein